MMPKFLNLDGIRIRADAIVAYCSNGVGCNVWLAGDGDEFNVLVSVKELEAMIDAAMDADDEG